VPWILGIAHPTGFPLFTLAGWAFSHALPLGTVAWRLNVLSGFCLAVAAGGLTSMSLVLGAGPIEAFLSTLLFTWCMASWDKGTHADPHAMSLMFIVLVLLFAIRYGRGGRARDLIVSAACGGLGLATHPEALYSLPAILAAICTRRLPQRRMLAWTFAALLLPLAFYAYLPLRSAYVAAHGLDPLAGPPFDGAGFSEWDANHTRTLAGFIDEVSGRQFGAFDALRSIFNVTAYPAALAYWRQLAQTQLPLLAMILAVFGAIGLLTRDRRSALILAAGTLGAVPFVYAYKNVESDIIRYLLPSFAVVAVLAAVSARIDIPRVDLFGRRFAACVVLMVAVALQWDRSSPALADRYNPGGQPSIDSVRRNIPDRSIVVAGWIDATSLQYAAFVDRSLGSRLIVAGWPGEFRDRYLAWTRLRPVYIYADPHTFANVQTALPRAWLTASAGSDAYHHIFRVIVRDQPGPAKGNRGASR
jgi:hypothetical protein